MQEISKKNPEKRIQWHPAFCSAVQLIFRNETALLEYKQEYLLNSKPLQIDLLIIKKPANCILKNSLGHLFQGHNLLEYKSPEDELGIDTYYKVYAYACLYKASGETEDAISAEDITISLVRHKKPVKLFSYLSQKRYQIQKRYPGIYHIKKDGFFDTQIIVTKELEEASQLWLRALDPNLEQHIMEDFIITAAETAAQGWRSLMDSVLEVVMSLNKKRLVKQKGEEKTMCDALREIMADEIEALEKNAQEAAIKGNTEGEERSFKLMSLLFNSNRSEDIKRAAADPDYRKQLFAEFQL